MGFVPGNIYSFKIIFRGNADSARINLLRESIPLRASMKTSNCFLQHTRDLYSKKNVTLSKRKQIEMIF